MDSSYFAWLCFLLLTVAAPHPNIAMPSDNSAEGTQDSSFGKTKVTIYHCKDCEQNICKSSNYEDFVKIGETQSETFSNEIIQLVTNETHIVMCFQQENTLPKGIFAIFWHKTVGMGDSCGNPNSGGSSENVEGNRIKTCCKARVDPSVPNSALKCYSEISEEKPRELTTISGIPQFSISEKSSIGIITPLLVLVVFVVLLAIYCVRQKRNGRGLVVVLPQNFNEFVRKTKWTSDAKNLFEKHLQMRKPGIYGSTPQS